MSELLGAGLPWWVWALIVVGVIALAVVVSGLFLPDWGRNPLESTIEADPGSAEFAESLAAHFNVPLVRGGEATILQNGDEFFPAMLQRFERRAIASTFRSTSSSRRGSAGSFSKR